MIRRRRREVVRDGETADEALDRLIMERVQEEERASRRARSEDLEDRRGIRRVTGPERSEPRGGRDVFPPPGLGPDLAEDGRRGQGALRGPPGQGEQPGQQERILERPGEPIQDRGGGQFHPGGSRGRGSGEGPGPSGLPQEIRGRSGVHGGHDAVAPQGQFLAGGEDQGHPGVRHGHDSGEPEGHGQLRGQPDGRPSASRELTAHQGQGQEWEVRPRQLEPYDGRETLSGNRRGPYGPGDAPAGGGVNPFWSPEVQRRAAQAQPVSAGRATTDDRGRLQGQEEDLEALRLRVMRDAEEIFEREVARLQAARTRDDVSYRTASEGGVVGGLGPPPLHDEGNRPQPPPPPPPPPRGLDDNKPSAPSHLSEALRNLELPSLPPPGGDLAALTFGDWVTVIGPLMADIAGSAQEWWKDVLQRAESTYTEWLIATPLEKLRLKPSLGEKHVHNHRVEQRGLSMLLAALPDPIRREIISARKMSATEIMFRLHQIYQPGGTSERGNLLKNLADPKVGNTLTEALQTLRLWRRWLARAEELEVALPDGLVLLTVLNKIAEAVGKAGAQASFRISSVRQELQVDVRPHLAKIKQFSEYLQAEAEELSLATALKTSSTTNAANPTQPAAGLKALATSGAKDPVAETGDQKKRSFGAPCRFWGTDGGCKKGGSCSYAHSWDGLEKNNRCFGCSGVGHSKRDCPVKKWDWGTSKTTATAPPKVSKFEKQKDVRSSGEGSGAGGEGARQAGSPGSAEEASREVTGRIPSTAPPNSVAMGGGTPKPPQEAAEAAGLMSEVAGLLKSLRSMKALQIKYEAAKRQAGAEELEPVALLDGGATHALRQARSHERGDLTAVEVELACGSTVLYKHPGTSALLTLDPVEPIIPLRMLVDAGFVVKWNAKGCIIDHPGHGRLHCWLRHGCPVMKRSAAMKLMDYLDAPPGRERGGNPGPGMVAAAFPASSGGGAGAHGPSRGRSRSSRSEPFQQELEKKMGKKQGAGGSPLRRKGCQGMEKGRLERLRGHHDRHGGECEAEPS